MRRLREESSTSSEELMKLAENTTLIVTGDFEYEQNENSQNQFVWYPVETDRWENQAIFPLLTLQSQMEIFP